MWVSSLNIRTMFISKIFKIIICRCYNLADISWFRREIGSIIFGTEIPTSTFEEALEYFKEAESLQPKFYWFVIFNVLLF